MVTGRLPWDPQNRGHPEDLVQNFPKYVSAMEHSCISRPAKDLINGLVNWAEVWLGAREGAAEVCRHHFFSEPDPANPGRLRSYFDVPVRSRRPPWLPDMSWYGLSNFDSFCGRPPWQ